ncbi:TPA: hypothetical protein PTW06_003494 [Clostridium botulinum]|nr:hypothetical protein [Clostridium botulinum]HDK7161903.1 hypothetical protein [Clostridium botulinum]HDK7180571.1 hypothetical protein [Clostridium botulinum]HDK7191593.1 hypothetical protein [Clostridium botulinum]HDK7218005.1 hypothetical protein [Clostridium botulinum]
MEQVEDIRHTKGNKEICSKRSQTIEQVFADAKELHGMIYTHHKPFVFNLNKVRNAFIF